MVKCFFFIIMLYISVVIFTYGVWFRKSFTSIYPFLSTYFLAQSFIFILRNLAFQTYKVIKTIFTRHTLLQDLIKNKKHITRPIKNDKNHHCDLCKAFDASKMRKLQAINVFFICHGTSGLRGWDNESKKIILQVVLNFWCQNQRQLFS